MKFRLQFLRNEAAETPEGGDAAPESPETPETTPAPESPEGAEEPEKPEGTEGQTATEKPGILKLAMAAATSKAKLIADGQRLNQRIAELTGERDDLSQRLDAALQRASEAETQLSMLRAEHAEVEEALNKAVKESASAEQKAVDIVAGQFGVDPKKLPEQAIPGESREELEAALAAEKDPVKRFQLAARINQIAKKQKD